MNSHSVQSSFSPFQFLTRKLNQFHRVHSSEPPITNRARHEDSQPLFSVSPEKILENHVVNGIQKVIEPDSSQPANTKDKAFSPNKIADRILAYVKKAYGEQKNNDPNFDKANFFSQVKQGIDAGFSSARDELDQLGLLSGQPKDSLDAAYANIQKGLSKLETGNPAASTAPTIQLQGISAQISQSSEVEIVTKEGDVVKIRLAQSASNSQSAVTIQQDGLTANSFQNSSESSSNFSVSIDGNLNEDEQNSVKKLLQQFESVGKEFFNGNAQDAFDHAQKIGLDTEQLASFSLSLSVDKSVQAVSAYQQAAFPDQQVEPGKIKQAVDFFGQARQLLKSAQSALQPFQDPLSAFSELFAAVNQLGATTDNTDPKPAESPSTLQQLIKPLGETVLGTDQQIQT